MARTSTYLHFSNRNAEAAFTFYKPVFDTEFTGPIVRFGDLPHREGRHVIRGDRADAAFGRLEAGGPGFSDGLFPGIDGRAALDIGDPDCVGGFRLALRREGLRPLPRPADEWIGRVLEPVPAVSET